MPNNLSIEERIKKKGVRPTSNRILVLRTLMELQHPASLSQLENMLQTLDKSSIFRTLTLFLDHDIVHAIEDGSGAMKYEACSGYAGCSIADMHVHFHCEECGRTLCLESLPIPEVPLPPGFLQRSVNYMVKGLCPACAAKAD